jgi:hypothetical protein
VLALWVISAPFGVIALVSGNGWVNRTLARVAWLTAPLGWAALVTIAVNLVVLGDARSELALWLAAPIAGLAIWVAGRGDDDDDGDPPPEPEPDGGPGDVLPCTARRRPVLPSARPRGHTAPRRTPTRVA